MTAQQKYEMIMSAIEAGKTVYVANYMHCYKITKKTLANWAKAGLDLFSVRGNCLHMRTGRQNDCIDGCAIKVVA